jgi:hypothetical protein
MGVFYETIPTKLIEWIHAQKVFWVATAPLTGSGHVNLSPKGGPNFGVVDERTFWYLDLSGSGNETISHLYEPGNGRITIMFNAFQGPPRIMRLWGKGRVLERGTRNFAVFADKHAVQVLPGTRSIIVVDIHQVGTSCGFSVPFFDFKEFRSTLHDHHERKEAKFRAGNEKESFERFFPHLLLLFVSSYMKYFLTDPIQSCSGTGHIRMPGAWTASRGCKQGKSLPTKRKSLRFRRWSGRWLQRMAV